MSSGADDASSHTRARAARARPRRITAVRLQAARAARIPSISGLLRLVSAGEATGADPQDGGRAPEHREGSASVSSRRAVRPAGGRSPPPVEAEPALLGILESGVRRSRRPRPGTRTWTSSRTPRSRIVVRSARPRCRRSDGRRLGKPRRIRGTKRAEPQPDVRPKYLCMERFFGSSGRSFAPLQINFKQASATLHNGSSSCDSRACSPSGGAS